MVGKKWKSDVADVEERTKSGKVEKAEKWRETVKKVTSVARMREVEKWRKGGGKVDEKMERGVSAPSLGDLQLKDVFLLGVVGRLGRERVLQVDRVGTGDLRRHQIFRLSSRPNP